MRSLFSARRIGLILLSVLLAFAACLPLGLDEDKGRLSYFFEVWLNAPEEGQVQVFYDAGRGFNEADSVVLDLKVDGRQHRYRFHLPTGALNALRFDLPAGAGSLGFSHPRINRSLGGIVHEFTAADFVAENEIGQIIQLEDEIEVRTPPEAVDPYLSLKLDQPLALTFPWSDRLLARLTSMFRDGLFPALVAAFLVSCFLIRTLHDRFPQARVRLSRVFMSHPKATLALLAALSVGWQLHPVIFCGRSFASPNNGTFLLYDHFPTLPGYASSELEDGKGSDIAAFLYQHMQFPIAQREALLEGEWPLWDRYDLSGVPLLGQGQTMFGELLEWIPIAANGAGWAWDVKFVVSRWLYAFGLALSVWLITRHFGASAVIAATGAWIGYFFFRANHAAQFAVCYAPWILVGWILLTRARERRALVLAAAALWLANWEVLNSGSVKEAWMMLPCLNLAGVLFLVFENRAAGRPCVRPLLHACVAGALLVLVSAPVWWVFFDTLSVSATSYDVPQVNQIPAWQLFGFFDDLAYRHLIPGEQHRNPSANLLVLLGLAWFIGSLSFRRNRGASALLLASLLPLALAFQGVPASWILRTPFLANIYHVGNTFSCPALVLLTVVAGVGFALFLPQLRGRISPRAAWLSLGLVAALLILYACNPATLAAEASPFFKAHAVSVGLALLAAGFAVRFRRLLGREAVLVLAAAACAILLWRHGQYVRTSADAYVFNPQVRAALHANSPAMDRIAGLQRDPTRVAGLGMNLYCGSAQIYFQEGIYGIQAVRSAAYDQLMVAAGLPKALYWGTDNFGGERDQSRGALDALNVRFYVDHAGASKVPPRGLVKVGTEDLDIFESPTVWPRAFFTNQVVLSPDVESLAHRLNHGANMPFASISRTERDSNRVLESLLRRPGEPSTVAARDYRLTSNTTRFTVDADGPGVIVLSETYYPRDFRARLNGVTIPYFPVNHAFKGILVPGAGTYEVRFEYWPHHLTAALWLAAAGLLAGLALLTVTCLPRKT